MILKILYLIFAYFVGNILGAKVLKLLYGSDITKEGSGNPGARNAGRVLGTKAFALVATIDLFKGFFVVILLKILNAGELVIAASVLLVVLGHILPVVFKFEGGKGVATFIGTILAISPNLVFILILAVALIAVFTRGLTLAFYTSLPFVFLVYVIEVGNMISALVYAIMLLALIFVARNDIKKSFEKYFRTKRV